MFSSRSIQVLLHAVAWLLFFGLVIGSSAINRTNSISEIISPPFLLLYTVYIFVFYVNEKLLLPRLYLQKKYLLYFGAVCALLLAVVWLRPFDGMVSSQRASMGQRFERPLPRSPFPFDRHEGPPFRQPGERRRGVDIVSTVLFISVWAVSMILALFRQWRQTEQRAARAELEKTNAELSFLKAQINPHFLFNTLNNIYALAVEKSNGAPEAIMKLSNIMRYVTDEARNDAVPLADEVDCIGNYISLQQLRLTPKTEVNFTVSTADNHLTIAPLLLMPFVENVFKYGVSNHRPSEIVITLTTNASTMEFFCRNPIFKTEQPMERTGIGIGNTKARLQHLYPARHELTLQDKDGFFTVQLTLQL